MKVVPLFWEDVQTGFYIEDKTGKVWRVVEFEPTGPDGPGPTHFVHMVDSDGKAGRIPLPPPLKAVNVCILNNRDLLEQELGAKEVKP